MGYFDDRRLFQHLSNDRHEWNHLVNFSRTVQAYNPNGTLQWSTIVYTNPADYGNNFALGPDGTIYLAGDSGLRAFTPKEFKSGSIKLMAIVEYRLWIGNMVPFI